VEGTYTHSFPTVLSLKTQVLKISSQHGRHLVHQKNTAACAFLKLPSRGVVAASASSFEESPSEEDKPNNSLLRSNTKEAFNLKAFLLRLVQSALATTAVLFSLALALLSITPTLLSHPSGLSTALHLVNSTVLHQAATVEIGSIKAHWRRPLAIYNIKIIEKINQKPTIGTTTGAAENSSDTIENSASPRTLVEIEKIKTTATLLDLALRGRPCDVIVASPHVDVSMNEQGDNLRVVQVLQDAGLAPRPHQQSSKIVEEEKIFSLSNGGGGGDGSLSLQESSSKSASSSSSLQEISGTIPFSGEIRAGNIHVALTSGQFLAPTEFQDLFLAEKKKLNFHGGSSSLNENTSPEISFEVLMGEDTIEEEARLEEQAAGFISQDGQNDDEESSSTLAEWARLKPSIPLPTDVGYLTSPMAVRVDSSAFKCRLSGWRTSAGYTYLASPLQAEMNLTPKLAQIVMNRLNPLLGDAIELRGNSKFAVSITPSDQIWPSASIELFLNPLRLKIGQGAVLSRGLEVLKLADRKISAATKAAMLQVDVSPLRAEIGADGKIVTKRVDLAIGNERMHFYIIMYTSILFYSYSIQ
jgi:hypothetical protein